MTNKYKTPQEEFWGTEFGCEYIERNKVSDRIIGNTRLLVQILSRTRNVKSVLELGANVGQNLFAIRHLLPNVEIAAVEINSMACTRLRESSELNCTEVIQGSILDIVVCPPDCPTCLFYHMPMISF
ncbi:MAG: hypothetical protein LBE12_18125 [Planctomycetaceae bacterium]|jgi:spore coat polysaccharide biosynthesis protein SpsF|nr:hypothetical protein [Planctomycetaceae bacterium]